MTSSISTDFSCILHLLILISGLFNGSVLATDPLEKALEELRTEWKKAFVGKENDFSERRLKSFTESLRPDEKFKQLELNPPLTKIGSVMLVALNKEGAYQRHMKILQDHDKPPEKTDPTQDKGNAVTQSGGEDDELKYHVKIVFSRTSIKFQKEEAVVENFIRSFVENTHGHKITEMSAFDLNDTNVYVFFEFWSWYIEHQLTTLRNGWTNKEFRDVTLGHFDIHNKSKELGRGNYGVVYKVTRNNDRKEFAMKDMIVQDVFHKYKDWPTRKRKVDHMLNEVDVLRDIESDFTIDMVGFDIEKEPHTKKYSIVTFLEYASGGELNKYIDWWRERRKAITGVDHLAIPEEIARDLFAHLAKALETLHKAGIGNRDIKPENILIDGFGRAKLTDFGLAKRFNGIDDHIFGLGSPPYQAPELVKEGDTHNQLVDWWSLTAVLYSTLTGNSAFGHENIETEVTNIITGKIRDLSEEQNRHISDHCRNFMKAMLRPRKSHRLSFTGPDGVMSDPWFGEHSGMKAIDWKNLRDMPMQWKPNPLLAQNPHQNLKDRFNEDQSFETKRKLWRELIAWRNEWAKTPTAKNHSRRIEGYWRVDRHIKIDTEAKFERRNIDVYYDDNKEDHFTLKVKLFDEFRNVDVALFIGALNNQKDELDSIDWKHEKVFMVDKKR